MVVGGINLFVLLHYIRQMASHRAQPALATWVFFTMAAGLSLTTYLKHGTYHWSDNLLNTLDLGMMVGVCLAIFLLGDRSSRFTRFDLFCLAIALGLAAFWLISQQHVIANLSIQLIMVLAYVPVINRMWRAGANTEPWGVWVALAVAPVFSLLTSRGILAAVYATRAGLCALLLLALMARLEWKKRKCASAVSI